MPDLDKIRHIAGSRTYDRGIGYKSNVKQLSSSSEMGGMFVTCFCKTKTIRNAILFCHTALV